MSIKGSIDTDLDLVFN